ncbi:MAG TPA: serine/threonine protein kinase [Thiotrichales bacterium]|nr:serine/threonine protein kinase [Thiotrichales bacterium]
MGLFNKFRADKHLAQCLQASTLDAPEASQCLSKLKSASDSAIPKIFSRLSAAEGAEAVRIREVLKRLIDTNTLSSFFPGLYSEAHPRVQKATVEALSVEDSYDPGLLLKLFDDKAISKSALLKVLDARKSRLNSIALLRKTNMLQPGERTALFAILEDIADQSIVPELVNRITAKDINTRRGIVKLLGHFDIPQARSALLGRLTDDSKQIRFEALDALAKNSIEIDLGILCSLVKDKDYSVQNRAIDALVKRNDPTTVKHLMDLLKDESEYVRRGAVEVLNGLEYPNAIEDLLEALRDADWWVRARAADALAKIGGPRVIKAVIKLLKSEDEYVRRSAVEILNSTRSEAAIDELMAVLEDSDWWVRERAIDALANIGNKSAVPALLDMMKKDKQAAPVVLRAMVSLGDETNVSDILPMLKSKEPTVAVEAMHTLAELVDSNRSELVTKSIKQRSKLAAEEVQDAATEALNRIEQRLTLDSGEYYDLASSRAGQKQEEVVQVPVEEFDIKKLKSGDEITDRYRFIRRIGKGAFSTVLLVKDTVINEEMILKVLHDKMSVDEAMIKRFVREIQYARKISHPHVIRIYDFLSMGNMYAISMEFFPSLSLSAELKSKEPFDFARALNIAADVASGLHAAHLTGVIHRDVKPGNILVDNSDNVKVVDFGISAAQDSGETKLTKTGILIGTPRYMAPEQVLGKPLDARTDMYSLGVILYEMLTGVTAFAGDDNMAVLYRHVHGDIEPAYKANPDIPKPLSDIVMKMMAVKPENRYKDMVEMEEVLRAYKP